MMRLKKGLAEVFGTEIIKGKTYTFFNGSKVAAFTFHGCEIEIQGSPSLIYLAKETPMVYYSNIHGLLELSRDQASEIGSTGPIVMVCGPQDVGKSTLTRLLVNYAVRKERTPLMADLDVGQGSLSVPGTIGLSVAEKCADVETGFSDAAPLIFHFGSLSPSANIKLYQNLISRCAECMNLKFESDNKVKKSGCIINTCGWVTHSGYDSLVHAAKEFSVDAILVLDSERLLNSLTKDLSSVLTKIKIIPVPKSGGVVERSKEYRQESRDARIREYFYGYPITSGSDGKPLINASATKTSFYPQSFDVNFAAIRAQLYKVGSGEINDSWLPIGMTSTTSNTAKLLPITGIHELKPHQLLSIIPMKDPDGVRSGTVGPETSITGVICITNIDSVKGVLTVLSPQSKPLPSNVIYLYSDVQFIDSH